MTQINKVILIGFTGNEPKVSDKVVRLSVATNYMSKGGQRKTDWHNVVAFGDLMESAKKIKKGEKVYVEGMISYGKYKEQLTVSIIASMIQPLITEEELRMKAKSIDADSPSPVDSSIDDPPF